MLLRSLCELLRRPARYPPSGAIEDVAALAGVTPEQVMAGGGARHPNCSFPCLRVGVPLKLENILDPSAMQELDPLVATIERLGGGGSRPGGYLRRLSGDRSVAEKHGRAALWGTPDLENALAWRKRSNPIRLGRDDMVSISS